MKRIVSILFLASIGCVPALNAYVVALQKYVKANSAVYCFADYHAPEESEINTRQQKQIIQIAQELKKKANEDVLIVAEDPTDYDINDPILLAEIAQPIQSMIAQALQYSKTVDGCPFGLAKLCKGQGIPFVNAEYRHAQIFALAGQPIGGTCIMGQLNKTIATIGLYQDHEILDARYKQAIAGVQRIVAQHNIFNIISRSQEPLMTVLKAQEESEELESIIGLCDSRLVDARILHTIWAHKDRKNIFVCAGQMHISSVGGVLEELGYTKESSVESEYVVDDEDNIEPEKPVSISKFFGKKNTAIVQAASSSSSSQAAAAASSSQAQSSNTIEQQAPAKRQKLEHDNSNQKVEKEEQSQEIDFMMLATIPVRASKSEKRKI